MWNKATIQKLIDTNDAAVCRAIIALYQRQTRDEQTHGYTEHRNNLGFNANDAGFLTSLAKQIQGFNPQGKYSLPLSTKQIARARPCIRKYWRQLLEIAQENELQKPA